MKKNKPALFAAAGILLFANLFFSCKTTAQKTDLAEVNPLALLSEDSSIYVNVPVQKHVDLTAAVLCAELAGLSEKDARTLAQRIERLYAGLGTVTDRSRLQAAALGDIPKIALNAVLTKKNGWYEQTYQAPSSSEALSLGYPSEFSYYTRKDTDFVMGLPSQNVFCVAKNVFPLLDKYALRPEPQDNPVNQWLNVDCEEIRFYITKPGQYLRNLIGIGVNGCDAVYGTMVSDGKGEYTLSFDLHLTTPRALRVFSAALELSFGMMGGSVKIMDETTVHLEGLEMTEKKIIDLFTRDPVTGKHYRVVGDQIVQENK